MVEIIFSIDDKIFINLIDPAEKSKKINLGLLSCGTYVGLNGNLADLF